MMPEEPSSSVSGIETLPENIKGMVSGLKKLNQVPKRKF